MKPGSTQAVGVHPIQVDTITGQAASLSDYRGKVLLIVNVASKCGLTPQYERLESLYEARRAEGLEILGFPSNDFGAQEPGANAEIAEFCSTSYGVTFPLFSKIAVKGPQQHPLYATLVSARPDRVGGETIRERLQSHGIDTGDAQDVMWNFEKFLVGRDGQVVERFAPDVTADDPRLLKAIDTELAKTNQTMALRT